jgi:secreted PhoX family phosphatase
MAGPFIFISQSRIKEGRLDDFKRGLREMAEFVEANEPRVIAFEAYLNDDDTEVTGVQIHPDADSMAFHMQVAFEKIMESTSTWIRKASRSTEFPTTPSSA